VLFSLVCHTVNNGDDPAHLTLSFMAYKFQCIIRQQGTTGPDHIWECFYFNDPAEGKATCDRKLKGFPNGQIMTLSGPKPVEVQIFSLDA